jgi:starvation-inducible DNA-binding protein
MTATNLTGLDQDKAKELARQLNLLLANLQVFYTNAKGFHRQIKGEHFFELHEKFEQIAANTLLKIDEVAERILTLGFNPHHSFSDYLKVASIRESETIENGKKAVSVILEGLGILLLLEKRLVILSAESNDEGTSALLNHYVREQEKIAWMYSSYLSE